MVQVDNNEPTLLMATFCTLHDVKVEEKIEVAGAKQGKASQAIKLDEPHAKVHLRQVGCEMEQRWHLNSGTSNHMTGSKAASSELDGDVTRTVRFRDGSKVEIRGRHLPVPERRALRAEECLLHPSAAFQHQAARRAQERSADQKREIEDLGPRATISRQGKTILVVFAQLEGGAASMPCGNAWRSRGCCTPTSTISASTPLAS